MVKESKPGSRERICSIVGDPKRVRAELADFKKSSEMLSRFDPTVGELYRGNWIAVSAGKIVCRASTLPQLFKVLDRKRIPRRSTLVRYYSDQLRVMFFDSKQS